MQESNWTLKRYQSVNTPPGCTLSFWRPVSYFVPSLHWEIPLVLADSETLSGPVLGLPTCSYPFGASVVLIICTSVLNHIVWGSSGSTCHPSWFGGINRYLHILQFPFLSLSSQGHLPLLACQTVGSTAPGKVSRMLLASGKEILLISSVPRLQMKLTCEGGN